MERRGLLGFSFLGNEVKKRKTEAERKGAAGNLRARKNQEPSELSWIRRVYLFCGIACVKIPALINSLEAMRYRDDAVMFASRNCATLDASIAFLCEYYR